MTSVTDVRDVSPSLRHAVPVTVVDEKSQLSGADAVSVPVTSSGEVPDVLGVDLDALARAGFKPTVGSALPFPTASGPTLVAVGLGDVEEMDAAAVRDAATAFASAVPFDGDLATRVPRSSKMTVAEAAAAIVEGVFLASYRFNLRSAETGAVRVDSLTLLAPEGEHEAVEEGVRRGSTLARVAMVGRDLATCPAGLLTASAMGDLALDLGPEAGLDVEVFDKAQLEEMGCGGLLGVNRGSVEPPRMIVMKCVPEGESTGHLAMVGKSIMYDSGGINLKPSDLSHSQMKNDMSGAGAILAAMTALKEVRCRSTVTAYLMCTDNMPSDSAMQLGDVLTMRNGKTVEVMNTDAEGRLVMADGMCLALEEGVDAIVDLATVTGACLRTFATEVAGLMGNDPALVEQVRAAGARTDEPVWELPMVKSYRAQLDSTIADMTNLGGPYAGSITAGLFLQEFVGGLPSAHIDITGTGRLTPPHGGSPKVPPPSAPGSWSSSPNTSLPRASRTS